MRTNIDIDDKLLKQAMKALGVTTKKGAVEKALRQTLEIYGQQSLRKLRGKIVWRGHDDDWFASDKDVVARRSAEDRETVPGARKIA
jgi:Arc/MetJ family transcription regulator